MSVTIKSIARIVGISPQAVSAVLNNKTNCRVSAMNRRHIQKVAHELGYCRSITAQIMRGDNTRTAAVVTAGVALNIEEHINTLLLSLLKRFNAEQYSCFLAECNDDVNYSAHLLKELISRGVRHFVFVGRVVEEQQLEAIVRDNQCTYVQFNGGMKRRIVSDMHCALAELWTGLEPAERENFKLLTDPEYWDNNRLKAMQQLFPCLSCEEITDRYIYGFKLPEIIGTDRAGELAEVGYRKTRELLRDFPDTKVIMYHSDHFLYGGLQFLAQGSRRIGRDIQLVGVNNTTGIRQNTFPLRSIALPAEDLTEKLFQQSLQDGELDLELQSRIFANAMYRKENAE